MPIFAPSTPEQVNELVLSALRMVKDPELRLPLTELGMIGKIFFEADLLKIEVKLTVAHCPHASQIVREIEQAIRVRFDIVPEVVSSVMSADERKALKEKILNGKPARHNPFTDQDSLTQVLLISSGKGGVGKSTIAVNLAVLFAQQGLAVGVLDADVFGHSIPSQMGIVAGPTRVDQLMLPPVNHEVKVISIGMFTEGNEPVAWRGPLLHRAIEQFISEVHWGALDVLLVDLPPGTGDVAISLGQLLPTAQVIVVTTPQSSAADVAERSGQIARRLGQKVIGVIENMSYLELDNGSRLEIFGKGGGDKVAQELTDAEQTVPLLARVPISMNLREGSDSGLPAALSSAEDPAIRALANCAEQIRREAPPLLGKKMPLRLA